MTMSFARSDSLVHFESFFAENNNDFLDDFVTACNPEPTGYAAANLDDFSEFTNALPAGKTDFIDEFLAEISDNSVANTPECTPPASPISPLSIPSPSHINSELEYVDEPMFTASECKIKMEPEIILQPKNQTIVVDADTLRNLANELGCDNIMILDNGSLPEGLNVSVIKTENATAPSQTAKKTSGKTKKEQNKIASQKYRKKKNAEEKALGEDIEKLKAKKQQMIIQKTKIQARNGCLVESIERKFAHLL